MSQKKMISTTYRYIFNMESDFRYSSTYKILH